MAGFHFYAGATRTILRGEAQCWKTKVFFVEDNMENCPQHEALEFRVKQSKKLFILKPSIKISSRAVLGISSRMSESRFLAR